MSHRGGRGYYGGRGAYRSTKPWESRGGGSYSRGSPSYASRGSYSNRYSDKSSSDVGGRYWNDSNGHSSYEPSRSRYEEMSRSYSSRGAREEPYKRTYRTESSYGSNSNRETGQSHRSPERKRLRTDSSQEDRSHSGRHESGNYEEYTSTPHRYDSGSGHLSSSHLSSSRYSSERQRSAYASDHRRSNERHISSYSSMTDPSRHSSSNYRSSPITSSDYRSSRTGQHMGPPSGPPPRRGSYRGSLRRGGGGRIPPPRITRGGRISSRGGRPIRRPIRGREALMRSLRIRRLKRIALRRKLEIRRSGMSRSFRSRKPDDSDDEKRLEKKSKSERAGSKNTINTLASTDDEANEENKNKSNEEIGEQKKAKTKTNGEVDEKPAGGEDEGVSSNDERNDSKSSRRRERSPPASRNPFIRLLCIHCRFRCVTFSDYIKHLRSRRHGIKMKRIALRHKIIVKRMRIKQRNEQRELDEKEAGDEETKLQSNFCLICKLNYKQSKAVHQASEAHKEMKRFFMPACRDCKITFRSPMLYESHLCSIEHMRVKANTFNERYNKKTTDDDSENEGELNLENFLTLDSIGDVDEEDVKKEEEKEIKIEKEKEHVTVGQEHIKKIEVLYCNLCRTYLTSGLDSKSAIENTTTVKNDQIIKAHCRNRSHLKRYVRNKEDAQLRETAERIHRDNQSANKNKKVSESKDEEGKEKTSQKENNINKNGSNEKNEENQNISKKGKEGKSSESSGNEKDEDGKSSVVKKKVSEVENDMSLNVEFSADIENDLGTILREVDQEEDEDEELDIGNRRTPMSRYDRFKLSGEKLAPEESKNLKIDDDDAEMEITDSSVFVMEDDDDISGTNN